MSKPLILKDVDSKDRGLGGHAPITEYKSDDVPDDPDMGKPADMKRTPVATRGILW